MYLATIFSYCLIFIFLNFVIVEVVCLESEVNSRSLPTRTISKPTAKQKFKKEIQRFKGQSSFQRISPNLGVGSTREFLNQGFYQTFYDTKLKIPIYSAGEYRVNRGQSSGRIEGWRTNPMAKLQPKLKDYAALSKEGLDRGHLYPQYFVSSNADKRKLTNLITNIAPQYELFNQNTWKRLEEVLRNVLDDAKKTPGNRVYVAIGVVPSKKHFINKINIPKYFWTAVCCVPSKDTGDGWSFAYMVQNKNEKSLNVDMYLLKDFFMRADISSLSGDIFGNFGRTQACLSDHSKSMDIIKRMQKYIGVFDRCNLKSYKKRPYERRPKLRNFATKKGRAK